MEMNYFIKGSKLDFQSLEVASVHSQLFKVFSTVPRFHLCLCSLENCALKKTNIAWTKQARPPNERNAQLQNLSACLKSREMPKIGRKTAQRQIISLMTGKRRVFSYKNRETMSRISGRTNQNPKKNKMGIKCLKSGAPTCPTKMDPNPTQTKNLKTPENMQVNCSESLIQKSRRCM